MKRIPYDKLPPLLPGFSPPVWGPLKVTTTGRQHEDVAVSWDANQPWEMFSRGVSSEGVYSLRLGSEIYELNEEMFEEAPTFHAFEEQPTTRAATASDHYQALAQWFIGNDTGNSSKYMAAVFLAGKRLDGYSEPRDSHDLGRCIRLIEAVPEVKGCFPILRTVSPTWGTFIDHWDELVAAYNIAPFPDCFELMKKLRKTR